MKLVFDGYEKYPNVRVIEVEQADLEHNLTISGYEEYEEELQTFRVNEKARIITAGKKFKLPRIIDNLARKTRATRFNNLCGPCNELHFSICYFCDSWICTRVPVDKPMVGKVMDNSAAQQAGLKENDTIQAIDGKTQVHGKMLLLLYVKTQIKKLRYK